MAMLSEIGIEAKIGSLHVEFVPFRMALFTFLAISGYV